MAIKIDTGGSGYVTPAVLQQEVDRLSAFKANKDGSYTIDGNRLTPAQRNSLISDAESKVSKAKKGEETTPKFETAKTSPNVLRDLKLDLRKIDSSRSSLESKKGSTKNVKDFDLLNSWIRYYDKIELDVSAAIQSAESGSFVDRVEVQFANTGSGDSWKSSQPPFTPVDTSVDTSVATPVATGVTKPVGDMFKIQPDTGTKPAPEGMKAGGKWFTGADGKEYYLEPGTDFSGFKPTPSGADKPNSSGGSGGSSGSSGSGGSGGEDTTPKIPTDWETAAQEQYGQYYVIIKSVPEIALLLKKAVSGEWSADKFAAKLAETTWYKTTSSTAREWDIGIQRDPASYQQQIDARTAIIKGKALTAGLRFSDETLSSLSVNSLRNGWDEQTLQNAIGSEALKTAGGVSQLRSGYIGQDLKKDAAQYGVVLSDGTFNSWVNKIAVGEETKESFKAYTLQMAKNLFPGISAQLDAGQTYDQITDPYRQIAARTLQINPETVDFLDSKWAKAVTHMTDKGEQRPMNFNEWGDYLRQTQSFGYEYTDEARSRAYEVSSTLANIFGKV